MKAQYSKQVIPKDGAGFIKAAEAVVTENTVMQGTFQKKGGMKMLSLVAAYVKLMQDVCKAWDQVPHKADMVNCKSLD